MLTPVFFLWQFAAFTYYVINCLISVTPLPTLVILLHIINLCFDVISAYSIIFYCY